MYICTINNKDINATYLGAIDWNKDYGVEYKGLQCTGF